MKSQVMCTVLCLVLLVSISVSAAVATPESPITLRGGHTGSPDTQIAISLVKWAQLVKERTNGAVLIEVYPAEQLGTERELMERVNLGAIDWALFGCGGVAPFASAFAMFENAFTFQSMKHFENVAFNREFRDELTKLLEQNSNMTFIGMALNGVRSVISTRPFRTPEEAKGLRLRIPDILTFRIVAEAIGATPTPLAFGEVYMAMSQGVVDAVENVPENMVLMKFVEVADNFILTEHMLQAAGTFINKNVFYEKLSKQQQDCLISTLFEVNKEWFDKLVSVQEGYLEQMKTEFGVNIIELTPQEKKQFQNRALEALEREYIPSWGTMWDKFLDLAQ